MQHYRIERVIGDGSFGVVLQATHLPSGDVVAIKRLKRLCPSFDDALRLREVQSLLLLQQHPQLVQLREVVHEQQQLSLVFEHCEQNLYQTIKALTRPLHPLVIRNIMWQVLTGVAYVHSKGLFHRDIKPENLLVRTHHPVLLSPTLSSSFLPTPLLSVQLADFGLAKDIRSRPPFTSYVSTRWYRAPELLNHFSSYSSPVDVWACACILAELLTLTPLFPGTSELDMLARVSAVVQAPGEGAVTAVGLRGRLKGVDDVAVRLLEGLLQWEPRKRWTAKEALRHDYFNPGLAPEVPSAERRVDDGGKEDSTIAAASDPYDDAVTEEWTVHTAHGAFHSRYFPAPPAASAPIAVADGSTASPPSSASSDACSDTSVHSSRLTSPQPPALHLPSWTAATKAGDSDEELDAFMREESARAERGPRESTARVRKLDEAGWRGMGPASGMVDGEREEGRRPSSVSQASSSRTRRMHFAGVGSAMLQ